MLVIASDGLWEFLSNDDVLDIVKIFYDDDPLEPRPLAERLVDAAIDAWKE